MEPYTIWKDGVMRPGMDVYHVRFNDADGELSEVTFSGEDAHRRASEYATAMELLERAGLWQFSPRRSPEP